MSIVVPNPVDNASSELEERLLRIWKDALCVDEIDRDSNFFDLGGDSLFAVALFLELERQLGVDLPVTTIYDAPTIAEMARFIEQDTASWDRGRPRPPSADGGDRIDGMQGVPPAHGVGGGGCDADMRARTSAVPGAPVPISNTYSTLVLLKPGTADRPLFIVHGIGGTVFELAALGRAVRIPEAVYAIQARGLDGHDAPHETIGQMVDHYLLAIRAVQPFGPYCLCGYSFGGLVAMEMARRLKAQGQSIGALILIDAYAHPFTWPLLSRLKMKLRRSAHLFRRALDRSPSEMLSLLRARMKPKSASTRLREWLLDQNPSLPAPLLRVREAGGLALLAYRPRPYAGPIMFLNARQRDTEFPDDPKRIWRRLALDIVFRTIPGGHRTIVTQHPEAAAAAIAECLRSSFPAHGSAKVLAKADTTVASAFSPGNAEMWEKKETAKEPGRQGSGENHKARKRASGIIARRTRAEKRVTTISSVRKGINALASLRLGGSHFSRRLRAAWKQ